MKKIARFLLAAVLVFSLFVAVVPAIAQEGTGTPSPDATATFVVQEETTPDGGGGIVIDWQNVLDWILLVIQFIFIVVALSYGTGISTEGLKDLLRWLTANRVLKLFFPDGAKSGLLAFLVALAVANGFDVTLFEDIPIVANILRDQPYLITMLTAVITWAGANFFKKQELTDYVYKATPTANYKLDTIKPLLTRKASAAPKA